MCGGAALKEYNLREADSKLLAHSARVLALLFAAPVPHTYHMNDVEAKTALRPVLE